MNLNILYQIISTLSIKLRLLPRPMSSGFCLLLFLMACHVPATLLASCCSLDIKLRAFAPALLVASACNVLPLQMSAWLFSLIVYVLAKVYHFFQWLLSYHSLCLYFASFLAIYDYVI